MSNMLRFCVVAFWAQQQTGGLRLRCAGAGLTAQLDVAAAGRDRRLLRLLGQWMWRGLLLRWASDARLRGLAVVSARRGG